MSEILEAVAVKNESLRRKLAKLLEAHYIKDKVERGWSSLAEEAVDKPILGSPPIIISGVDGGNNKKSLLSFDVYVIKAYAEGFRLSEAASVSKAFTKKIVDVDVIIPTENSGDRLTLYRQVAELKMLYYSAIHSNMVLADGSLESLVTRPIHLKLKLLDSEGEGLEADCERLRELIVSDVFNNQYQAMSVKGLVEEIAMSEPADREGARRRILYLEMLEKAVVLGLLLEKLIESGSVLVFITKTGRSMRFFNAPVSDQYLLTYMTRGAGYYLDDEVSFEKPRDMIGELPRICGLRGLAERLTYVRGLVRLDVGAPVFGIEVIYNADKVPFPQRDVFLGTLGVLRKVSTGGYPQPLYLVDRETHIDNGEVEKVITALGLSMSLTGREVLEYE